METHGGCNGEFLSFNRLVYLFFFTDPDGWKWNYPNMNLAIEIVLSLGDSNQCGTGNMYQLLTLLLKFQVVMQEMTFYTFVFILNYYCGDPDL